MAKFCKRCGHELHEDQAFCPECGTPVSSPAAASGGGEQTVDYESYLAGDDRPWYSTDIFHVVVAPMVRSFDNGNFFRHTAKTVMVLLALFVLLAQPLAAMVVYGGEFFHGAAASVKALYFVNTVIWLMAAIFSFGYWVRRVRRLDSLFRPDDEFVVVPVGTYLFQWLGEWVGLVLTVFGVSGMLLSAFDVKSMPGYHLSDMWFGGWGGGMALVLAVVVVFTFRVIAENVRALTSIANNTGRGGEAKPAADVDDSSDGWWGTVSNVLYALCLVVTLLFALAAVFDK